MITIGNANYYDDLEVIEYFKDLLKPRNNVSISESNQYANIINWLNKNKYVIKEFPQAIHLKFSLEKFGTDIIRNHILKQNPGMRSVPWQDRRNLIDSLTIQKEISDPTFELPETLENIMRDISFSTSPFNTHSMEFQLHLLNNCIEFLLKKDDKYKKIDSSIFYGFFTESDVKKFRKETQIYRHHSEDISEERQIWTDQKKSTYIRIGIIMISEIYRDSMESQDVLDDVNL